MRPSYFVFSHAPDGLKIAIIFVKFPQYACTGRSIWHFFCRWPTSCMHLGVWHFIFYYFFSTKKQKKNHLSVMFVFFTLKSQEHQHYMVCELSFQNPPKRHFIYCRSDFMSQVYEVHSLVYQTFNSWVYILVSLKEYLITLQSKGMVLLNYLTFFTQKSIH